MSTSEQPLPAAILAHGGAWAMDDDIARESIVGLRRAMLIGMELFQKTDADAVDVAQAIMRDLEDDPVFDAGTGSFLTSAGEVELDALIGTDALDIGSVAGLRHTKHPIDVARHVMERLGRSGCVFLAGDGAENFARECGVPPCKTEDLLVAREKERWLEFVRNPDAVVGSDAKSSFRRASSDPGAAAAVSANGSKVNGHAEHVPPPPKFPLSPSDTVGVVVRDRKGKMAVALTTGGTPMKRPGRIGDTPLWGSGGYAYRGRGAASTGFGEDLIRVVMAKSAVDRLVRSAKSGTGDSMEAAKEQVDELHEACGGYGGVLLLGPEGPGVAFNTPRMVFGYWDEKRLQDDAPIVGCEPEDLAKLRF
ncbi:hypothetical protein HDU96_007842 [Phlyctochytrium bullatum]|nr:hypothetical protein HDU96_007842 [Phlyctochytrium bullatum]